LKVFIREKYEGGPGSERGRYGVGVRRVGRVGKFGVDNSRPFSVWKPQDVDMPANEGMAAIGGSHTARQEAREFLQERLEAGPVKAIDVIEEAKQNGIAKRTLIASRSN